MFEGDNGSVCEDITEHYFQIYFNSQPYFVDDASGSILNSDLVRAARGDAVQGVYKYQVFDEVPISECYSNTGQAPISTKWVDVNKGDASSPDHRSRWVGREF